jgi:hypothetical protein
MNGSVDTRHALTDSHPHATEVITETAIAAVASKALLRLIENPVQVVCVAPRFA